LAAPHPADLHAAERAGLAQRFVRGEALGVGAARYVDDQHAAGPRRAVIAEQGAAKHEDVLVFLEVGEMRRPMRGA
jgi:hypothetical protein